MNNLEISRRLALAGCREDHAELLLHLAAQEGQAGGQTMNHAERVKRLVDSASCGAALLACTESEANRDRLTRVETELHAAIDAMQAELDEANAKLKARDAEIEQLRKDASYATKLAIVLHAEHFPEDAQWKPLPDLVGVLTQIDNMASGLARRALRRSERWRVMTPEINELLTLAAKACGHDLDWCAESGRPAIRDQHGGSEFWEPHLDDGDGARMEAKLYLRPNFRDEAVYTYATYVNSYLREVRLLGTAEYADHNYDDQAARRMASLRAAAEIGKGMP